MINIDLGKVFKLEKYETVADLLRYAICPTTLSPVLCIVHYIIFILFFPFIITYWYQNETKLVFNTKDDGDVMLTKFIGKFKHNYADTVEVFTDNRQNDVDLKDISLTWHMKG